MIALAVMLLAQPVQAPAGNLPRVVQASGEGRVTTAPDIARVVIGVDAQDQSLSRANADATNRMNRVKTALEKAGIAAKDVRTVRYAIDVQRSYEKPNPGAVIGYRVVNQVLVTVREIARVGPLLDQVVAAGANDIGALSLEKEDISADRARALEKAVADARARATVLAKAAGASLGDVLQVSEGGGPGPVTPMAVNASIRAAHSAPVPISSGDLEIVTGVEVVFAIR